MSSRFAQQLERLLAAHRTVDRQRGEIGIAGQCVFQHAVIAALGHLDRAEAAQVIGDILRVEQRKPPARRRATRCTNAIFEASRARWNMLSPKKARPSETP